MAEEQEPLRPLVLSHSLRGDLMKCPRKFALNRLIDTTEYEQDTYAADVGTALHIGVQNYVQFRNAKRALVTMLNAFPYDAEYAPARQGRTDRGLESVISVFYNFIESFQWDEYDCVQLCFEGKETLVPGVEISFAIELLNTGFLIPVYYMGHIDLLLQHKVTGEISVFDLKTTRRRDKFLEASWKHDQQTVPYGIVLSALTQKSVSEFNTHYLVGYIDVSEPKVVDFPVFHDAVSMNNWVVGLAAELIQLRYFEKVGFPRTYSGEYCVNYGHPCSYSDLCNTDAAKLQTLFPAPELKDFYNPEKAQVHLQLNMAPYL